MIPETIQIERYQAIPEKPGFRRHVGNRSVGEVYNDLQEKLRQIIVEWDGEKVLLWDTLDYFSTQHDTRDEIPSWKWIACFPVTGGSEGHYIHIEVIDSEGKLTPLYLGKTFCGWDMACKIANEIGRLLGA